MQVKDETSGVNSPITFAEFGAGSHSSGATLPVHWVFPVKAGAHTYSLKTAQLVFGGGGFGYFNPILIAQFVPFNGTGSQTSAIGANNPGSESAAQAESAGSSEPEQNQ